MKALPQALSLVHREAPLVQTADSTGRPFVKSLAAIFSAKAKKDGKVLRINHDSIDLQYDDGTKDKIKLTKNLPFNQKGFIDTEEPLVKVGDKVTKGQILADNNYTKKGDLALGLNLNVAYMPYKGYNHEDGLVLSQSAADRLASHHAYKYDYAVTPDTVAKKELVRRYFPSKFTKVQLAKLDELGYAKPGVTLEMGDPIYAVLERKEATYEDKLLGRLHKTLVTPYRLVTEIWHNSEPGLVVDAHTEGKDVRILMRTTKGLEEGDKPNNLSPITVM